MTDRTDSSGAGRVFAISGLTWDDRTDDGLALAFAHRALGPAERLSMTTTRVRSLLGGPVLLVALLGITGLLVPFAHADAVDDKFLAALKSKGISFASPQAAIVSGHEVCDELDLGRQSSDVAAEVMKNSNLDSYKAGFFVGVSVAAFCPRHSG